MMGIFFVERLGNAGNVGNVGGGAFCIQNCHICRSTYNDFPQGRCMINEIDKLE